MLPKDNTFDEIVAVLKKHFEPKPLIISECFKFNGRQQQLLPGSTPFRFKTLLTGTMQILLCSFYTTCHTLNLFLYICACSLFFFMGREKMLLCMLAFLWFVQVYLVFSPPFLISEVTAVGDSVRQSVASSTNYYTAACFT